jgi:hypothetical protein
VLSNLCDSGKRTSRSYSYCRRCRSKLAEPVENLHAAFCCRGCWNQFYRSRCIVCEESFHQPKRGRRREVCLRRTCKAALRENPDFYRPFGTNGEKLRKTGASRTLLSGSGRGVAEPSNNAQESLGKRALEPAVRSLRGWRWVRLAGNDDDWELFDRAGHLAARVRSDDDGYWLTSPRMVPMPPVESQSKAMARGQMAALGALPSTRRNSRRSQPAQLNPLMEEAFISLKLVMLSGSKQPFRNGQNENLSDRIVLDGRWPGMYRIRLTDGGLSDLINLTRAKNAIRQMEDQKVSADPSALKGKAAIKPIPNQEGIAEDENSRSVSIQSHLTQAIASIRNGRES